MILNRIPSMDPNVHTNKINSNVIIFISPKISSYYLLFFKRCCYNSRICQKVHIGL